MFVKAQSGLKNQHTGRIVHSQSQFQTFRNSQDSNQFENQEEDVLLMKLRIEELQREIASVHQRSSNLQKENERLNQMILRNNTREAKRTEHFIEKLAYICANKLENNHRGKVDIAIQDRRRKQGQIISRKSSSKRKVNGEINSFGKTKIHCSSTFNDENNSFIGNKIDFVAKKDFKKMINQKLSSTHLK